MAASPFTDGFQRRVLAAGIAGIVLLPSGAWSIVFDQGAPGRPASPRSRVAAALDAFYEDAGPDARPSWESVEQVLQRALVALAPEERALIGEEWTLLSRLATDAFEDLAYLQKQASVWWARQQLSRAMFSAADLLERPDEASLERARLLLTDAAASSAPSRQHLLATPLLRDAIERSVRWTIGDRSIRVPSGWSGLDRVLGGGIRPGEVLYFLAPPKSAKTTFLLNAALGGSRARKAGVVVSYEMREQAMLQRMERNVAQASKLELRQDVSPLLSAVRGMWAAGAGELWIAESTPMQKDAVGEVERLVDRLRLQGERVDFLVLDFLNIMGSAKAEREKRHELARIAREIAGLAKRVGLPVWSAALVKKEAVNRKKIQKSDIAESFEVIAVADGAIAIASDEEMRVQRKRALYATALRDEEDERFAGTYIVDLDRMRVKTLYEEAAGLTLLPDESNGGSLPG
jgi:KaiC/GvpD/RAD55 family RecA-like ATPase